MAFFGITNFGPQNFIKNHMRDEYKEPRTEREVEPLLQKVSKESTCPKHFQKPISDEVRQIDIYLGRVNGFAYGSLQRLNKMKLKRIIKPVGPIDIYKTPTTSQSEYGWFLCDPDLKGAAWFQSETRWPQQFSPNTKTVDIAKRINKYASLF